jgi:hypothetical protein
VLDWSFLSPLLGDAQVSYALRIQLSGGVYKWWNGASLQTSEVYETSSVTQVTLPSGILTSTDTYSWSVSVTGSSGLVSGYCTPWVFTVLTQPATPTLTASYSDTTNTVTLTAQGSAATAPIGSIEFSNDGGVTWQFVFGASAFTIYPGPVTFYDIETSTQSARQYRCRCWSLLPLNYSAYATASIAAPVTASYWIGDPQTNTWIPVLVKAGSISTAIDEAMTVHWPLGNPFAVVVADVIHGPDFQVTLVTQNPADQAALDAILSLPRPIYWQSPVDTPLWVRRTAETTSDVPVDGAPWVTYHEHALTFVAVARPAP